MSIKFDNRVYTERELIEHVWDVEEVMDVMNRRVYYQIQGLRRQELNDLWVRSKEHRETASFGRNYGFYVGMDEIVRYYIAEYEAQRQEILDEYCAEDPSIKNLPANLNIGFTCMQPNSTPLVEVAGDGATARGIWYSIAQVTTGRPNGKSEGLWRGEKVAADFVREDGEWKIWHLMISTDYTSPAGQNHGDQPLNYPKGEDPLEKEIGNPTISVMTHDYRYHWSDNYPPVPEPYETFSPSQSYGPEGCPNVQKMKKGGR